MIHTPQVSCAASLVTDEQVESIIAQGKRHTTEHVGPQIVLGGQLIAHSKEIRTLGAFDRDDPSSALDMLGFRKHPLSGCRTIPQGSGRRAAYDWMGGSEINRTEDMAVVDQSPEKFTPYVSEDGGGLIDRSSDDLYLFSSGYPHVEGGEDPIGRFETFLGELPAGMRCNFYAENLFRIVPDARVH